MNIRDILKEHDKTVAIVHYRTADKVAPDVYRGAPPPQNPAVNLQVTLSSEFLSPSKNLIRFGQAGDEIVGWTHVDALYVVEILGTVAEDGKTVVPLPRRGTISITA